MGKDSRKDFGIQSKGSDQGRHSSAIVPSRWYYPFSVLDDFFFCTSTVQHHPTSLAPSDSNSTFHTEMIARHGKYFICYFTPGVKSLFSLARRQAEPGVLVKPPG